MDNKLITVVLPLTLGVVAAIFLGAAVKQRMDLNAKQTELNERGQEIGALKASVDDLNQQAILLQQKVDAQPEPAFAFQSFQEMFNALPACGPDAVSYSRGPSSEVVESESVFFAATQDVILDDIRFNDMLSGYKLKTACRDGQQIPFILSRVQPTQSPDGTNFVCVDRCDEDIFGIVHSDDWSGLSYNGPRIYVSKHQLGFIGEAYNNYCKIDKVLVGEPQKILLACGNGELGGLGTYYQYTFGTDELIVVKEGDSMKRQDLFDLFSTGMKQQDAFQGGS